MHTLSCAFALCATLLAQEPKVDFVREVAPILQAHCVSCHGADKQKGDLRLDARVHAFPVDEEEGSVVAGDVAASELVRRIELPDGDEERMPNEGPRLSPESVAVIKRWIQGGAEWPESGDAFFEAERQKLVIPKIDFGIESPATDAQQKIDDAVALLRKKGVLCERVAVDSAALDCNASLAGAQFGDAEMEAVAQLAPTLVWLNLGRTNVTDAGLVRIAALPQLRRLSVANTSVSDVGIASLGVLPKLEVLNVYGSKVGDAGLLASCAMPQLRKVYAFASAVTESGAIAVASKRSDLVVDRGEYATQRVAAAEREVAERKRREEPANEQCIVSGDKPSKEHFVDVDGLRVVFCCGKCKKKYEDDPAAFAAKVEELRKKRQESVGEQKQGQ